MFQRRVGKPFDGSEAVRLYKSGLNLVKVGKILGVDYLRVKEYFRRHHVKMRSRSEISLGRPRGKIKICKRCGGPRDLTRNVALCPECWVAYEREKTQRDRFARYGITEQIYFEMLNSQGRRCAICKSESPGANDWHIDHCHKTGIVRGILCHFCNTGLGSMKDSIVNLQSAITYLSGFVTKTDEIKEKSDKVSGSKIRRATRRKTKD